MHCTVELSLYEVMGVVKDRAVILNLGLLVWAQGVEFCLLLDLTLTCLYKQYK